MSARMPMRRRRSLERTFLPRPGGIVVQRLKTIATVALYALMLIAVLALWNNEAPRFIYVAF